MIRCICSGQNNDRSEISNIIYGDWIIEKFVPICSISQSQKIFTWSSIHIDSTLLIIPTVSNTIREKIIDISVSTIPVEEFGDSYCNIMKLGIKCGNIKLIEIFTEENGDVSRIFIFAGERLYLQYPMDLYRLRMAW